MKQNKGKKLIRILLFLLLPVVLFASAYLAKMGIEELTERHSGENFYTALLQDEPDAVFGAPLLPTLPPASPAALPMNGGTQSHETAIPEHDPTAQAASQIDFSALWTSCPDVVGWVKIDGTVIDYPIVQGMDNDYYLQHLPDGSRNKIGSIMLDCANSSDFSNTISILHGHHMRSGAMFGSLAAYKQEDFYLQHPTIQLFTPGADYEVQVFAAYTVNGYSYGYPIDFENEMDFDSFLRKATASTSYETDVQVSYGDRLLLLSTCAYSFEGARYVVLGKICE